MRRLKRNKNEEALGKTLEFLKFLFKFCEKKDLYKLSKYKEAWSLNKKFFFNIFLTFQMKNLKKKGLENKKKKTSLDDNKLYVLKLKLKFFENLI
jgi:hypothetical protein